MMKKAAHSTPSGSNKDRIQFHASTNCIELVNVVDHNGEETYCFDSNPAQVPLYGPDGVSFINKNNPKSVAMMMKLYAASWESLDIDKHRADQERKRNMLGRSSHSQDDPPPS